jgi:hypothetical protein
LKSPIDLWRKWARLPPWERRLLVQAWAALHVIYAALWIVPFETVRAACQRIRVGPRPLPSCAPSVPAASLAWLVNAASRYSLAKPSCLHDALALSWLMSKHGIPSTLQIGVMRSAGDLAAHAWIEHNGQIILGQPQAASCVPLRPCPQARQPR